jgi:hypothetical protein
MPELGLFPENDYCSNLDFKVEMNFSSPDDMLTHSERQTKLRSILQITFYISLNLLTNKYTITQEKRYSTQN